MKYILILLSIYFLPIFHLYSVSVNKIVTKGKVIFNNPANGSTVFEYKSKLYTCQAFSGTIECYEV